MPPNRDARLRELQFLGRLDREGRVDLTVAVEDPDRLMILHLLNLIWNDRCQCLLGGGGPVEGPKATDEAGRFDDESL